MRNNVLNNLAFQHVDNPRIARNHHRQWQQIGDEQIQWWGCFPGSVCTVDTPRDTVSIDDVCAQNTQSCYVCRNDYPDDHQSTIHHLLFDVELQTEQYAFSARQHTICLARYMLSPARPSVRLSVCPSDGCIIEQNLCYRKDDRAMRAI